MVRPLGAVVPDVLPDAINDRFVPARAAAVYTVEVEGEAVLLDEDSNRLHLLNSMAALLWACFDSTSTIKEIVTDLSEELGAPYRRVLRDTLEIVRRLGQEGLLDGVAPAPADGAEEEEAEQEEAHATVDPSPPTRGPYRFLEEPPNG